MVIELANKYGELIKHLIKEVENAEFKNIEDVVAFVKWWMCCELSYLGSLYLIFFLHLPQLSMCTISFLHGKLKTETVN